MPNTLIVYKKPTPTITPALTYTRALLNQLFTDLEGIPISIPPLIMSYFASTGRTGAISVACNGKIYVGTGYDGNLKRIGGSMTLTLTHGHRTMTFHNFQDNRVL